MKQITMAALLLATGVQAGELNLELAGKGLAGNKIHVAVYSANVPEQFPFDEKPYRATIVDATNDRMTMSMPDIPSGKYAVAVYVDNNRNGKLDKNSFGVPKEMYGFSNDARGMFGPPDFAEAVFEISENPVSKTIQLH